VETPRDRQELLDELDRLERELGSLTESIDEARFNWRPDGGRAWSIGQCVEHLIRTNVAYVEALARAVERAGRRSGQAPGQVGLPLDPGPFGGRFVRAMDEKSTRRFRAPSRIVPGSDCPRDSTLADFGRAQADVRELVRSTVGLDVNRIRFANPFLVRLPLLNVAAGILVIPAHERRHLRQARKVAQRPDFPKA
jgi:hypothetical protein